MEDRVPKFVDCSPHCGEREESGLFPASRGTGGKWTVPRIAGNAGESGLFPASRGTIEKGEIENEMCLDLSMI